MDMPREHLAVDRPASARATLRTLRAMWTSTWSIHAMRFGPRQAWWHPIVRALTHEHIAAD
jgi:hypothetical protein